MSTPYGNATDFAAYHVARGRTVVIGSGEGEWTEASVNAALLVASEWLDARYGQSFSGFKTGLRDQIRQWPRTGAWDIDEQMIVEATIPVEVLNATYEAAYRERTTAGALSKDYTPALYKKVAVSGAVSVEYAQFSDAYDAQTDFQVIDEIIGPLLTGTGSRSAMSGAAVRV